MQRKNSNADGLSNLHLIRLLAATAPEELTAAAAAEANELPVEASAEAAPSELASGKDGEMAVTTEVVWDPEEGFNDLMSDIAEQLNPGGDWYRWWVYDISTSLDRAVICDGDTYEYFIAPFTLEGRQPKLAPSSDWTPVESTWIAAEDEASMLRKALSARLEAMQADGSLGIPEVTDVRPEANPEAEIELPEPRTNAAQIRWEAILLVEDSLTEDGRYIAPGATKWRDLPLTLMAMTTTPGEGGHADAFVAGRIDRIWKEGNLIMGAGVFNDDEDGRRVAGLVTDRSLTGNSVDLAVLELEMAPRSDFDENGKRIRENDVDPLDAIFGEEPFVWVFRECIIGMSTVCPFPAFADAEITVTAAGPQQWRAMRQSGMVVVASAEVLDREGDPEDGLTASAAGMAPEKPPKAWFADPELTELTPLTITDDGRIYGHLAPWGTCHIGVLDVCVTAPASEAGYEYFHLGELETEEGDKVPVGKITFDTGHAPKHLSHQATVRHYDDTGTVGGEIIAGEDEFGVWVAGALRPELTAARVRELRAATLSGDWRKIEGHLELVAALAVNVPGFPIPRTRALLAAGEDDSLELLALTAAGVIDRRTLTETEQAALESLAVAAEHGFEGLVELAAAE